MGIFALLGAAILAGGWLIREQFDSNRQMLGISAGLAAAGAFGLPFTSALADMLAKPQKASAIRSVLAGFIGAILGLIFLAAGAYLTIYYINSHYLTVVNV